MDFLDPYDRECREQQFIVRFMESESNQTTDPNQSLPGVPPPFNGVRVVRSNNEVHVGDIVVFDEYFTLVKILDSILKVVQLITNFIKNQNSYNVGFRNSFLDRIATIHGEIVRCDSLFEPHDLLPVTDVLLVFYWLLGEYVYQELRRWCFLAS